MASGDVGQFLDFTILESFSNLEHSMIPWFQLPQDSGFWEDGKNYGMDFSKTFTTWKLCHALLHVGKSFCSQIFIFPPRSCSFLPPDIIFGNDSSQERLNLPGWCWELQLKHKNSRNAENNTQGMQPKGRVGSVPAHGLGWNWIILKIRLNPKHSMTLQKTGKGESPNSPGAFQTPNFPVELWVWQVHVEV